ncbi:MAG: glycerophosphodiester phosphodiesterase family protein [Pseudomonadota bacterium]
MAKRFQVSDFVYAHRGLWTMSGPAENSMEAFLAAASQGLGIEFDVRPAADGVPMIFHDPILDRMTQATGWVEAHSSSELADIPLKNGGRMSTLQDLLDNWPSETPLLCELKIDGTTDPVSFAKTVATHFESHSGPAAMMSFSRDAVAAIPDSIMRGQLILPSAQSGATDLAATPIVSVDYLACHTSDAENVTLQAARAQMPLVTWTVIDVEASERLAPFTDSQIFEAFDPALAKRHILNT